MNMWEKIIKEKGCLTLTLKYGLGSITGYVKDYETSNEKKFVYFEGSEGIKKIPLSLISSINR